MDVNACVCVALCESVVGIEIISACVRVFVCLYVCVCICVRVSVYFGD